MHNKLQGGWFALAALVAFLLVFIYSLPRRSPDTRTIPAPPPKSAPRILEEKSESVSQSPPSSRSLTTRDAFPLPSPSASIPELPPFYISQWKAAMGEAYQKMKYEQARERVLISYSQYIAAQRLSPDDSARLLDLLIQRRIAPTKLAATLLEKGVPPEPESDEFADGVIALTAKINDEVRAAFGDALYSRLKQFDAVLQTNGTISNVDSVFRNDNVQLTTDQRSNLVSLLTEKGEGRITNDIVANSHTFLSAEQVQILRNVFDAEKARIRMYNSSIVLPPPPR